MKSFSEKLEKFKRTSSICVHFDVQKFISNKDYRRATFTKYMEDYRKFSKSNRHIYLGDKDDEKVKVENSAKSLLGEVVHDLDTRPLLDAKKKRVTITKLVFRSPSACGILIFNENISTADFKKLYFKTVENYTVPLTIHDRVLYDKLKCHVFKVPLAKNIAIEMGKIYSDIFFGTLHHPDISCKLPKERSIESHVAAKKMLFNKLAM